MISPSGRKVIWPKRRRDITIEVSMTLLKKVKDPELLETRDYQGKNLILGEVRYSTKAEE